MKILRKKVDTFPEDSLERAAYLIAHMINPVGGKWMENKDGKIMYRFEFQKTEKAGKLLMDYKESKFNRALTAYGELYRARGRYVKAALNHLPLNNADLDLSNLANNLTCYYA